MFGDENVSRCARKDAGMVGGLMSTVMKAGWMALAIAVSVAGGQAWAQGASPDASAQPAAVGGGGWSAQVAPPGTTSSIVLDEHQTKVVQKVTDYFNKLEDLKGSFVQTGADRKMMRGKFFMKRPGRFRFEYARPSLQVIISDGEYLAIQDHDLNNEDRISLDQTPFRMLLRKDVDLIRDARIVEVQESEDVIVLSLQDKNPDAPGRIKLFFASKPELELKEWVTTDAQGLDTRVEVGALDRGTKNDPSMFKIKPMGAAFNQP